MGKDIVMANAGSQWKDRVIEHFELHVDAVRASRGVIAFALPLIVCHWLKQSSEALFISMAALNLSLPDLRGAYGMRLSILATMTLVASGAALLGAMSGPSLAGSICAMGGIALLGGVWRHLSADYGPSLAVSSALLFLLGLSQAGGWVVGRQLAEYVLIGGGIAALLHICYWLIRPQHALRYTVAETWVAASDLIAAMRPETTPDKVARGEAVARRERELRAALDRTFVILGIAENKKQTLFIAHLEDMRREVVHLAMRLIAFNTSLEAIIEQKEFARCVPVVDSVLLALSEAARSVALTLIIHRTENFAATSVRWRRCQHLIKTLDEQIAALALKSVQVEQVRATLQEVNGGLPRISEALRQTADQSIARQDFSASLPDLSARSMKSLGAWIRPATHEDPVLIRYAVRMAVFTMLAVGLYKGFNIHRGYWMAFTIMVVLQPDYGSTRQRAGARIGGTVSGVLIAGGLLWLSIPFYWLDALSIFTAFLFAYFVKRNYGVAIFFVTINLVLTTETLAPVQHDFMITRVLSTLAGGGLALVAARLFWPIWEGEMFPTLLASAIRANRTFLLALAGGIESTDGKKPDLLMPKRHAENANRYVAASVERLLGEPSALKEKPERAAALATYNQRITRALTVLAVQLPVGAELNDTMMTQAARSIGEILEKLAQVIERAGDATAIERLEHEISALEKELSSHNLERDTQSKASASLMWFQLSKTMAEIRAMTWAINMIS